MLHRSPLMLVLGLLAPIVLVAGVAWWWLQRPQLAADAVAVSATQLAVLDEPRAITLLRQFGDRAQAPLATLVAGLISQRPALVTQAKLGLLKQLDMWQLDESVEAERQRLELAELLAQHAQQADATGQRVAIDLATRMLTEPCADTATSSRLLTACEQVLQLGRELRESPRIGATSPAEPTVDDGPLSQPGSQVPQFRLPDELQLPPLPTPKKSPTAGTVPSASNSSALLDPLPHVGQSPELQRVPERGTQQSQLSPHVERQRLADLTLIELLKLWHDAPIAHRRTIEHELKDRGITARQIEIGTGLTAPNATERLRWIEQLPRITGFDAKPWLLWLSQDSDAQVRLAALGMMATASDPAFVRRAGEMSASDADSAVRELASKTLRGLETR